MNSGVTQATFGRDSRPTLLLHLRATLRLGLDLGRKVSSYLATALGGDSVVVPGDVFFGFGGSGYHGADLISRWLDRQTDDRTVVYVDSAYKRQGC